MCEDGAKAVMKLLQRDCCHVGGRRSIFGTDVTRRRVFLLVPWKCSASNSLDAVLYH